MNTITLTGVLTNDPARRDTTKGVVTTFRIAADDRPQRLWIDIETWGHLAGTAATHLHQGRHIAVTGRLRHTSYHDSNTGQTKQKYFVAADRITYLDTPTFDQQQHETPEPATTDLATATP